MPGGLWTSGPTDDLRAAVMLFSVDAVFVAQVLRPALATARRFRASTSIVATFCFAEPVLRLQAIRLSTNVAGVIFVEKR